MSLTPTADKVISIARAEIGYHEGRSGGHWNNHQKYSETLPGAAWSDNQPWCDTFAHWVPWTAGVLSLWPDVTKSAPAGSASCDVTASAWKKAGRWSEYPALGAQVFFGSPSDLVHTGLVVQYDDTFVWSVEGNTNDNGGPEGDGVYIHQRKRSSSYVIGYGYPAYPEGILSADPAWAAQNPKPAPKPVRLTRIHQFLQEYQDKDVADLALLEDAVTKGRRHAYRPVLDNIRAEIAKLPPR